MAIPEGDQMLTVHYHEIMIYIKLCTYAKIIRNMYVIYNTIYLN